MLNRGAIMKKVFLIFIMMPFLACSTFLSGRIPEKREAKAGSVIAIKLSSENTILHLHMKTGWFYERMQRFGNYYVLFNVPPGKYELDHGDAIDQQFFFDKDFIKSSAVEITNQEFVFLGAFNLKIEREADYYVESGPSYFRVSPFSENKVRYTFFSFPEKQDDAQAKKEFVAFMQDKIKGTPWESIIR